MVIHRGLVPRTLTGAGVAAVLLGLPAEAGAVRYGISDQYFDDVGQTSQFQTLQSGLQLAYARLIVPYNAVATSDANGNCVPTASDPKNFTYHNGIHPAMVDYVKAWLSEAQARGLDPMISLTFGNTNLTGETASSPGPGGAVNPSYPTTNGYACGILGLMQDTASWGLPVHEWEAFNEPDGGLCASDAAAFDYLADVEADSTPGQTSTNIVAGAFGPGDDPWDGQNHPDCGHPSGNWYIPDYVTDLENKNVTPHVFSWHPYSDVSATYTGNYTFPQTSDLDSYLNLTFPSHPLYWLTEAGVHLNGAYEAGLDGSPIGQANAAWGFKNLQNATGQAYSGQVQRIYWYEFESFDNNAADYDRWDSAMVAADNAGYPDGNPQGYPLLRPAYCVLAYGDSASQAASDPSCNDTLGFTQPVCGDAQDQHIGPAEISEPADVDWEDPCNG